MDPLSTAGQRFLVTGGSGFIGSAVVRRLVSQGYLVANFDAMTYAATPESLASVRGSGNYLEIVGDIANQSLFEDTLRKVRPTRVVNLAAETHVDRSIDGPLPFLQTNVLGTGALLDACTRYWLSLDSESRRHFRFVHTSTDEVFGSTVSGQFTVKSPYAPTSPYAASKAASDHLARTWYQTYGLPTVVSNCGNNYGPFQFPEKLIPLMITRALTGRSLPIYGDGSNVRDWIHVDDHVSALLLIAAKAEPGTTYLVGARNAISNLGIVRLLVEALDSLKPLADGSSYGSRVEFVEDRPGHDQRYALDPSSVEALGFSSTNDLGEGIRATVGWYLENQKWWTNILSRKYDTERLGLR